jgi:IS605 OrfB family transposase
MKKDFLHKLTTAIIKDFDSITIETLKVSNLLKNKKLSRSIHESCFYMFKNTKVDWISLELALINKMALQLNNEIYLLYVQSVKKYHCDYEFDIYGENLVSNDLLKKYISKIIKWCKKNYNRMSQIKKVEKAYNQKYYLEHKEQKGIKSRIEVNKINGAKRHQDSKTLVLKYALELVASEEKITIKTIKNIIEQNNEKLILER